MTEEQIRQNANEYAEQHKMRTDFGCWWPEAYDTKQQAEAYIAGAHSLDEEIKELNVQVTLHKDRADYYHDLYMKLHNPWISVNDRLPEEGQTVIVRLAFGAGNHATCNYSNGQFVFALCIETSNINIQSMLKLPAITHWMPIPETPLNK